MKNNKTTKRFIRHRRVRAKIKGTVSIPRLCVFRSNRHIYCQLIDDQKGKTMVIASDMEIKSKVKSQKSKVAEQVGELLAKKAAEKKIEKVVFDRGGYKYHGRIKALAEGARKGGLKF
ncbi:MAG: 50S ribosomal protein L18 [bacterium]|nr:50S ribosomal protein L18 [bacterium]